MGFMEQIVLEKLGLDKTALEPETIGRAHELRVRSLMPENKMTEAMRVWQESPAAERYVGHRGTLTAELGGAVNNPPYVEQANRLGGGYASKGSRGEAVRMAERAVPVPEQRPLSRAFKKVWKNKILKNRAVREALSAGKL